MKTVVMNIAARVGLIAVFFLSGCCGGLRQWGGTRCDNFFSANWTNRQAKFDRSLKSEAGKKFPTSFFCSSGYSTSEELSDGTKRYIYKYLEGCTYSCSVSASNIIMETSHHGGQAEKSCYMTLN